MGSRDLPPVVLEHLQHTAVKRRNPECRARRLPFTEAVVDEDGVGLADVLVLSLRASKVDDPIEETCQTETSQRGAEVAGVPGNQHKPVVIVERLVEKPY